MQINWVHSPIDFFYCGKVENICGIIKIRHIDSSVKIIVQLLLNEKRGKMITKNEINRKKEDCSIISYSGFTKVAWYDSFNEHEYYDANLNGQKVEVRTTESTIEWRNFSSQSMEEGWFLITDNKEKIIQELEKEKNV